MAQKALCLFCGAGGMVVGIDKTDVDVVGAVDFSEPQINTVEKNFDVNTYSVDLSSTNPQSFEDTAAVGDVDIITGGPPCQGFSLANINRKEEDERNSLVFDYIDYVNYYQPNVFVMENVSGMKSIGDGSFINEIQKLFDTDYNIKLFTFCASDFGVPQKRERVFVVGAKKFIPSIETDGAEATVKDAIYDLPDASKNTSLPNHIPTNHKQKTVNKISNTERGGTIYESYNQNQRLCWDEPSPTIVGSGWKYAHPDKDRAITNRERALLQSFPREYEFVGNKSEVQQMIGNAVPPLMSYKIIDQLTP
jgi:DNA (cytosine-5)-methyltransferase 1